MLLVAFGERSDPIIFATVRSQRDRGNVALVRRKRAHSPDELLTVHLRHGEIADDQVWCVSAAHDRQRLFAGCCHGYVGAVSRKQGLEEVSSILVVVVDEDPEPAKRACNNGTGVVDSMNVGGTCLRHGRQSDSEDGPLVPPGTGNTHGPTVQFNEAVHDRQAQPEPPPPCVRRFHRLA